VISRYRPRVRRTPPLLADLCDILLDRPNLTVEELISALAIRSISTSIGDVKTILNAQRSTFLGGCGRNVTWSLTEAGQKNAEQRRARRRPVSVPMNPGALRAPAATAAQPLKPPTHETTTSRRDSLAGITGAIHDCLLANPNLTAGEIVQSLLRKGTRTDRASVNRELYRHRGRLFAKDTSERPRWRAISEASSASLRRQPPQQPPGAMVPATPVPKPISLYAWQRRALDAWERQGHRGVVEAVTGTGKTRVGMMAIRAALAAGGVVHVLVPTIDLQDQWCEELQQSFPQHRVGRRGNDRCDTFLLHQLVVSVVNSARDWQVGHVPQKSLLVADECHRYGADGNARALRNEFERRLGLTATFARDDSGCESYLAPYFGATCFRMGYAQAIADEVTAHFKVALVGVDFDSVEERVAYEKFAREGASARKWLTTHSWAVEEPFGDFMKDVAKLAEQTPIRNGKGSLYTAVGQARDYLRSFSGRRKLLAGTVSKNNALGNLVPAVRAASRTIVFTETIETAAVAAVMLSQHGIRSASIHSAMHRTERREILQRFAQGQLDAITAPRVLDEGIDVPEADLAIIFATSKTRRQMVQRMGRVLRRKADGRFARFIVLYVEGTTEDPAIGAHESFIGEIADRAVAEEVRTFESRSSSSAIVKFLNDFTVPGGQPPARMADE
jgi:superfamily II DNA or RNA helicase